jgi:2-methylcitrate dehydratase PrpD
VSRTLTEQLAGYWASARYEDMSPQAVALAKRFLIDTLAAGIAGARTPVVNATLSAAQASSEGTSGSAAIWGREETMTPALAAMINGTSAHAQELDDFGGCGHSGAVVVPALFGLAGRGGVSGKEALVAMLAGYDLAARTLEGGGGYRPHNDLGWHSTGTCGSFGAAAASARLLKLDAARFADALGIAGSFTGGIWAFLADGADTKRFHPGKASENGVTAAFLAQAGMTGPRQVLEAKWGGFYSTFAHGIARPELTLEGLGKEFRIDRSGMKPYACCRGLHACMDAILAVLAETGAKAGDIEALVVHGNAQYKLQFDRMDLMNMLDAQFSIQYGLAVAATSGRGTLDQFLKLRNQDPEVRALMQKVTVKDDRRIVPGEYPPLEVRLKDGRTIERFVKYAKGAPENPLSDAELAEKVESLIAPVLGAQRCREIVAVVGALESLHDLKTLVWLLTPDQRHAAAAAAA